MSNCRVNIPQIGRWVELTEAQSGVSIFSPSRHQIGTITDSNFLYIYCSAQPSYFTVIFHHLYFRAQWAELKPILDIHYIWWLKWQQVLYNRHTGFKIFKHESCLRSDVPPLTRVTVTWIKVISKLHFGLIEAVQVHTFTNVWPFTIITPLFGTGRSGKEPLIGRLI